MKQVQLCGRLGADPELQRVGDKNTALIEQDVAVDDYDYKTSQKTTCWVPIIVWGQPAEFLGQYARKGDGIVVNGELVHETYTSKKFTDEAGVGATMHRWSVKASPGGVQLYSKGDSTQRDAGKGTANDELTFDAEDDIPF